MKPSSSSTFNSGRDAMVKSSVWMYLRMIRFQCAYRRIFIFWRYLQTVRWNSKLNILEKSRNAKTRDLKLTAVSDLACSGVDRQDFAEEDLFPSRSLNLIMMQTFSKAIDRIVPSCTNVASHKTSAVLTSKAEGDRKRLTQV